MATSNPKTMKTMSTSPYIRNDGPMTIADWKAAQLEGDGLKRLQDLVEVEQRTNGITKTWVALASPGQLQSQWERLLGRADATSLPLFGVPFAAKDNIDVQGFPTTAGCPAFSNTPAVHDATVIARLKAAGAIVIGKTNLDQFATGLVGTRSPHGAAMNSFDAARVSGGSSSGSGVAVGRAVVPFSLGTDTAGSGRVPAGFNNIIGLKPTRGGVSAKGVVPACRTLDCVSIFALTVEDAETALSVAEAYDVEDSYSWTRQSSCNIMPSPGKMTKIAVCKDPEWPGEELQRTAYEVALQQANSSGWNLVEVDFSKLFELAVLLYEGPWVAERYAAIQAFIESTPAEQMNPVVRSIMMNARNFTAADAFNFEYRRQDLCRQIEQQFAEFDALLVPTSPTFPTIEQLRAEPIKENSLCGTYTNFVNFLGWSAIAIPAGFRSDGLPFSITLIAGAWKEPLLFGLSRQWFGNKLRRIGATQVHRAADGVASAVGEEENTEWIEIAVVGAHLTGYPLNKDLTSRGARLLAATRTTSSYRLFALDPSATIQKPGLKRIGSREGGAQIAVEVWLLPTSMLSSFMNTILPPLGLGSIQLQDGRWVRGFICEPVGLENAMDITEFGGWKAYTEHALSQTSPTTIKRVLIANRGEIAVRIISTLKKLNITAIVIHSEADAAARHVRDADVALPLKGQSVLETYLNGAQILDLAKANGADAIIPGYGFLSENSDFASSVEAAGLLWIGPTPRQMSDLGLKHKAREIAIAAKIPTVPGSADLIMTYEEACVEAARIGFPLMIKSTAGGGGIGLRRCHDVSTLKDDYDAVRRLGAANFGDDGVFLERYVENARHIEVQILGDGSGKVIAAGERDCSLQRRHQKVIEESPAFAVPESIRQDMRACAVRLASSVKYRNVGTVEFIYDIDKQEFYFLEVNTRLQVEHPVTEAVTGLDLVECMVKIASGNAQDIFEKTEEVAVKGASIEVRLYAESPIRTFQPCAGRIERLRFPSTVRVDTWIEEGTEVSVNYDPLLAKLIARGETREQAVATLAVGLAQTEIVGVETNLEYLKQIIGWSQFSSGDYNTKSLDQFQTISPCVQVVAPGASSTIQDYPGRKGFWNVGIPPSGPMDHLSFRLANKLVGNPPDAAALEYTLEGATLKFHRQSLVAVVGGTVDILLDDNHVSSDQAFVVQAGQLVKVGLIQSGYRVYLAVAAGFDVPKVLDSRSSFELGDLGQKKLSRGDILPLGAFDATQVDLQQASIAPVLPIPAQPHATWAIGVVPGPHGALDYFTPAGLEEAFSSEWQVHHNSNRLGVRLTGPKPQWARDSGGEAGFHPSNIHDTPYSIGSISFTGDQAVILTADGPSLGGFVAFCVVTSSEMWKVGQLRPGDSVRLQRISAKQADQLDAVTDAAIEALRPLPALDDFVAADASMEVIAGDIDSAVGNITIRQAGNRAMLLEFGGQKAFDIQQSFRIHTFCQKLAHSPLDGIAEVTPGVCTVHILLSQVSKAQRVLDGLISLFASESISTSIPSRILHLPLAFDDTASRAAVQRYANTIRSEAPWLPSNVDFLAQLNGLPEISSLMHDATFVVLGLGDVFLGSPCAIPLDPRHRLYGTKYNPSRSFTPRGSVGLGGQYLCVYATESPGGYQLVGRTVDIWDKAKCGEHLMGKDKPWLFKVFDRIKFYPISEHELDSKPASELIRIEDGIFDLEKYEAWVDKNREDIAKVKEEREQTLKKVPFLQELRKSAPPPAVPNAHATANGMSSGLDTGEVIKATVPGKCYKVEIEDGALVEEGDALVSIYNTKDVHQY